MVGLAVGIAVGAGCSVLLALSSSSPSSSTFKVSRSNTQLEYFMQVALLGRA
jgi:hypothetical protein